MVSSYRPDAKRVYVYLLYTMNNENCLYIEIISCMVTVTLGRLKSISHSIGKVANACTF